MAIKIVLTDCSWGDIDIEKKYLPQDAVVEGYQCKTEDKVISACADADGILAEYATISQRVLRSLKNAKSSQIRPLE